MKPVLYLGCPAAERASIEKALTSAGLAVGWVDSADAAVAELRRREAPVLIDFSRGAAALQHVRDIRQHRASALMFAVVDSRRHDLTIEAVLAGMADVFARPPAGLRIARAIDRELAHDQRGAATPDDLYGHSPAMREIAPSVERAAGSRGGVMIVGEEGTGRQVTARLIHGRQNAGGAFVTLDCSAFAAIELDAVLFGTAPGGGKGTAGLERIGRKGALYAARGGALYIRHVADLPARAQSRLWRLLRDQEAVLAESGETIVFDVRPMFGVEPGFDAAVAEGQMREDLFKRLAAARVDLPPLRERREDIPLIANFALRSICARQRVPPKVLSRPALTLITALPWRGNAAELIAHLEAIVKEHGGPVISLDDTLPHVQLDPGSAARRGAGTLKQAREAFERHYIAAVLENHGGRIGDTAKALGIQRTNLYRKMRSLRIRKVSD